MRMLPRAAACLVALLLWGGVPATAQTAPPAPVGLDQVLSGAEQLQSTDLEHLLDAQLDTAAAKSDAAEGTGDGVGDGIEDTLAAQKAAQRAGKALASGRRAMPKGAFVGLVLGSALVLALLSAGVVRVVARRVAQRLEHETPARPRDTPEGVRYSWHYRDAVDRLPPPPRTRRR